MRRKEKERAESHVTLWRPAAKEERRALSGQPNM